MRLIESLLEDARVALRVLRKSPGATALSLISIGLGIGITTALFSLVDAYLLRPFPFERPGEIFTVTSRGDDSRGFEYGWLDYQDMLQASKGIADLSAYQRRGALLAGEEANQVLFAYGVTPNHFAFLGVKAQLGKASVAPIGSREAVVIGNRLWRRRFGGDPQIVGKTIVLTGRPFVVAGVLPREFQGVIRGVPFDVWVSTDAWFWGKGEQESRVGQFDIIARLKPGITPERAAAQFDAAIRGIGKHKPAPQGIAGTNLEANFVNAWRKQLIAGAFLAFSLGLILFIGCANAAQLRMAQGEARRKELSIRRALGASAWHILRLLVVETGLVCIAGAAFGLMLAQWLMHAATSAVALALPIFDLDIRLDHRSLLFCLAAALACVLLAGLAPARHAAKVDVNAALKSDQGMSGRGSEWRKKTLVAVQIAVTVVIFGAAMLSVESARHAAAIRPGLDPTKKVFVISVIPGWHWPSARWCEQACARLAQMPGVRGATFARHLPLSDAGGGLTARVEIPGQAPMGILLNNVAGNYFPMMGTHVVAGRGIEPRDRKESPLVVVISQQFVRQAFGGRNPIGEWISVDGKMRQVVGISEDAPANDLHERPAPYLYVPFWQAPSGDITLMVETSADPDLLGHAVRQELKRFDPKSTAYLSTTLRKQMDEALFQDRLAANTTTGLGAIGFLLTAAGLFGLIQYAVNRRAREIGLRMALGAQPGQIHRMVLGEALRIAAWGIPIGLALLAAVARFTSHLLIGVQPLDPAAYLVSAGAAIVVALGAAWLPAVRAARAEPMAALRSE